MYKAVIFALILPLFSLLTACNSSSDSPTTSEKETPQKTSEPAKTVTETPKPDTKAAPEKAEAKEQTTEKEATEAQTPETVKAPAASDKIDFSAINAVVQEGMNDAPSAEEAEKKPEKQAETETEKQLDVEKLQKAANAAEKQVNDTNLRNSLSSIVGEAMEDQEFKE